MPDSPWLVIRISLAAPALRVIALPYAGGNATVFDAWRSGLPPGAELCAVQLPGRHDRVHEPPLRRMSVLLQALEPAVRPLLKRPYLIYGDSHGAVTAFELVRRLRRRNQPLPQRLVVSSAQAPHVAPPLPDYAAMNDTAFLANLISLGLMEPIILEHPDLVEAALPTLRADFELARSYRYRDEPTLKVPITAIRGERDAFVTAEGMQAWDALTTGSFEMITVAGGHDMLQRSAPELLSTIRKLCETEMAHDGRYTRKVAT